MNVVALGSVCQVTTGQSAPQESDAFGLCGIPFVRAGSLERLCNGESENALELVPSEQAAKYRLKVFPKDTIVFAKSGMSAKVGRVHRLRRDCHIVSHLAAVLPSKDVDPGYLHRWFEYSPPSRLIENDAYPSIKASTLEKIELPLPAIAEQRRIAAILDKAGALRAKRREAIAKLDHLLESIFLETFGDPVFNPRGWPIGKLADLGELDRGVSRHRPRGAPELLGGNHPLIQTGDVARSGGYIREYSSTYSDFGLKQSKKWPAGTLCITIAANIADTGILTFDSCFPDSVVGFTANPDSTVEYVQALMGFLRGILEERAPQVAQKNINLSILRELPVPIPPAHEQQRWAEIASKVDGLRMRMRSSAQRDSALFATLQGNFFSGGSQ